MNRVGGSAERTATGQAAEGAVAPLLRAKLHRPAVAPGIARRARLLARFDGYQHRGLTLISAAAGYGKTTLASSWLETLDGSAAWISLDERDDLVSFTSYLVAAAQGAFPDVHFKTQALLRASMSLIPAIIAHYLADDLEQAGARLVLALDDIHLIKDPAVFDLLAELIRYPLACLHLLLIGRRDPPLPIASLRARGQVTEIRARDLMLTPSETARFLEQMLQRDIPLDVAVEWTEKTEGWVTGLHLGALALLHRGERFDVDAFDAGTGDLLIGARPTPQFIQDYLWDELLAHLPPAHYRWLLRTSLLDRLTPSLCEAVCGSDANDECVLTGAEFLRWLHDNNLFLVALDGEGQWYRLHYLFQSLLRGLLQQQMRPDEIAALRRRASAWHAANGLPDEAIQYALAGDDVGAAVRLVEQGRYQLMNTEQWARLDWWLRMLPAEAVANSVLLINTRGFLALQRDDMDGTMAALQRARQLLSELPPESENARIARAELGVLPFLSELYAGRVAETLANAQSSLQTLPADALHIRSLAIHAVSLALHMNDASEQALDTLGAALSDPTWPASLRARLLHYLSLEHYLCGDLPGVFAAAAECVAVATDTQRPGLAAWGRYYLGAAHYARNDLVAAEPHLLALMENMVFARPATLAFGAFVLALIRLAQGRADEATEVIETVGQHLRRIEYRLAAPLVDVFTTELALRQGRPVQRLRAPAPGLAARLPDWYFYAPRLTEIKLLLADGRPDSLAAAQRKLAQLETALRRAGVKHTLSDVLALQALVLRAEGKEKAALERLAEALQVAEPGGFIRSFVDLGAPMFALLQRLQRHADNPRAASPHLARVLAAFSAARPSASPVAALLEPLTGRERQLLRLLASDLSPDGMAQQLAISSTTARTHIRNIYAKLGVHSRYEAVQRAREMNLL